MTSLRTQYSSEISDCPTVTASAESISNSWKILRISERKPAIESNDHPESNGSSESVTVYIKVNGTLASLR